MPNLPLDPTDLVLTIAIILAILLYLREYNQRKKLESEGDRFLREIKEKGWETLNQSIKKSQAVIGQAELEGIKVIAGSQLETAKFEQDLSKQLSEALNVSKQTIIAGQNQLLQFMQDLQKRSEEFEGASKKAGQERINQLFDRVEQRLSDFMVQTAQQTTSSIELELKSTRQLIDTYKSEQLKLIDENIVAMMEKTLSIVLAKKLSLKDQLELVYEALEKAKVEKFVV
ncbi:hypothetical protein A2867_03690 [Candidatus Daviesbacteria bacterium RIFCSPHIGHO2_01_FULL_40_11]|uniref:Uncharacterized protein n=1 Tax=Candidatus Daviesbacteria bacterium RIFCSPHIGHO2_01_FULL_40_11 TaxID=1797762 RepID=A0A1F5JG32_9BACT|nr:MAG: hypothetical protein A2867_03690 [Candidatus Daviesbacteria bacterium RIFCSPHIGHO2_01_FULL_40_11]